MYQIVRNGIRKMEILGIRKYSCQNESKIKGMIDKTIDKSKNELLVEEIKKINNNLLEINKSLSLVSIAIGLIVINDTINKK